MGKRKKSSRTPQGPKKREPLATTFKCVFCNNEYSVSVKIDKKNGVGTLNCKTCAQNFQTATNYLSAPVDVYADWIDACDAVAKETAGTGGPPPVARQTQTQAVGRGGGGIEGDEDRYQGDDFVEDDEGDAEGEYADE